MTHHHSSQIGVHPSGFTPDQIEDLEAKFAEQQTIVNLCCIPSALAFLFLTHVLLIDTARWIVGSDSVASYKVLYQPILWWFFPGFGALCLCFEITLQIWALFVGRNVVNLYSEWDSRQPKKSRRGVVYYDCRKVLRWFTFLIAIPIGIFTALALNMHSTFGDTGLYEFGYAFGAPKIHSYEELRQVARIHGVLGKHGAFIERPYLTLDFADGERWSQENWDDSKESITNSLQTILQKKTKLPFVTAEIIEDLPHPVPR